MIPVAVSINTESKNHGLNWGHNFYVNDGDFGITKGIVNFCKRFYLLMLNFGHTNCETEIMFFHQYCCSLFGAPAIEISNDLCEWPIAPEPLREQLCEQLRLCNGPIFSHVSEWKCSICVSCARKRATAHIKFQYLVQLCGIYTVM